MSPTPKTAGDRIKYRQVPFGYWRSREDLHTSPYPWPVIAGPADAAFLAKLSAVETEIRKKAPTYGFFKFMGASTSRLTGEALGAQEFFFADDEQELTYVWPVDYGAHYLAAGVQPAPEFMALIDTLHHALIASPDAAAPGI